MRIAVSTGGGDAPGLNAAIRGVVLAGLQRRWEMFGICRGFGGLLDAGGTIMPLGREQVRGIAHIGGTILGSTNRGNPFTWPSPGGGVTDRSDELIGRVRELRLDVVVVIGGDGSQRIALDLWNKGMPVVGIPKTIDNDLHGTAATIGFDTAVGIATEAIDRLHSTAESHERVMVVEVMGRYAGWIALNAGIAGGADVILIPEIPFELGRVAAKIMERENAGRRFAIVVVAEGAISRGGSAVLREAEAGGHAERLGGIGERVCREIAARTGKDTRSLTLGHLQRGGSPTTFDRLLGLRFGTAAARAIEAGALGHMVALVPPSITTIPLAEALSRPNRVQPDSDTVLTARDMGICLGD